jgi:hypothetical protein
MRILLRHQMQELVLNFFDNKLTLWSIAVFDHSLNDSASIMFVAKLMVLISNQSDALLNQLVLFFVVYLAFLHQQSTVVDLHKLN